MAGLGVNWSWSPEYNDWYYVTQNTYGQPYCVFSKTSAHLLGNGAPQPGLYQQPQPAYDQVSQSQAQPSPYALSQPAYSPPPPRTRQDSGPNASDGHMQWQNSVAPSSYQNGFSIPNRVPANAGSGANADIVKEFDPSYWMRTRKEAFLFFQVGRVFSMLHIEAAGGQAAFDENDDAYTEVRYGQLAHSNIRRFIIVEERREFVYACAISTYRGQGALKKGCNASEHGIIYFTGTEPTYYKGERERGMDKAPIRVNPASHSPPLEMKPESRIRYSKRFAVEKNIKVKDIGQVCPEHMSIFLNHCKQY